MKALFTLVTVSYQKVLCALVIALLVPAAFTMAQTAPPAAAAAALENPLSTHNKFLYAGLQKMVVRAAELMPEEHYAFKPTEDVRSFGRIVGHIADAQYLFCAPVLGEKNPSLKIEQTKTSKADLIAALKEAFAYCGKANDSLTDASATQTVKMMGSEWPKLSALTVNQIHGGLHYGNIVTYMRLKNVVPPSSDPEFMKTLRK